LQAKEANIPLRILEMDNDFDLKKEQYMDWPQLISTSVTIDRLAEYRENTKCNLLRELPCAICSEMISLEHWTRISVKEINLSLLKTDEKLVTLFSDLDFNYEFPCIDESGYKILLDRNGFIK